MYTSMTSTLSLLLLALIPATIAAPPPSSTTGPPVPIVTPASIAAPPIGTGSSCKPGPAPVFPAPIGPGVTTCTTEGAKACTVDETSVLLCTGGKWVSTNCGQKEGFQMACRSYSNLMTVNGCPSYGPVYTECTGYEDADVHESVSSLVGWDAQATRTAIVPTASPAH